MREREKGDKRREEEGKGKRKMGGGENIMGSYGGKKEGREIDRGRWRRGAGRVLILGSVKICICIWQWV